MRSLLTQARLREFLNYDAETGAFTWVRSKGRAARGSRAGSRNHGYIDIELDGCRYLAHRLAWLYVHGRWPADQIDHANGVRDDNRIANLRECDRSENAQNVSRAPSSDKKTRLLGANWFATRNRWRARIQIRGRQITIGYFDTAEQAHAAYLAAKADLHPFAVTGERRKSSEGSASAVLALATPRDAAA